MTGIRKRGRWNFRAAISPVLKEEVKELDLLTSNLLLVLQLSLETVFDLPLSENIHLQFGCNQKKPEVFDF